MVRLNAIFRLVLAALAAVLTSMALAAAPGGRTVPPPAAATVRAETARGIIDALAAAWRGADEMPLAEALTFAVRVSGEGGGTFSVTVSNEKGAVVTDGADERARATFVTDIATLRAIAGGQMNVMTAMARARASDPAPVTVEFPKGFRWTPALQALYLPLTFHFFQPDVPEVVRFGEGTSLPVHGARSTILYYDRGLRTSWYQLDGGMHINGDSADQKNPFSSLVIVTRGSMHVRVGGVERQLREGQAILVPKDIAHEFWAAKREYAEFILVMFGDGA